jgi:hypothetical protein
MAVDTNCAISAPAPRAFTNDEDTHFQDIWTKTAVMLDFTTIAVFIIGTIAFAAVIS